MGRANADHASGTPVWTTAELAFVSEVDCANPYLDLDVAVVFTGPSGREIRREAFWDGGRCWRVRFAPVEPGRWEYRVTCSDAAAGLDGRTGHLQAVGARADHDVLRHGFLRSSDDGRHLCHVDGTPFFWLADTHWRFLAERWDGSNRPGWSSQFRGMVDTRAEQGFSVYQTNILSFDPDWAGSPIWGTAEPFTGLDIDFMQREMDPRMDYIARAGLVNALGLGWFESIDSHVEGMKRFARYIVARYGSLPMVWTLGGEVGGYDPSRRAARIAGWRDVALTIAAADDYGHPRTAHLTNERPIAEYFQNEPWLTFTLHQHGHGDLDTSPHHYADHLAKYPGPLVEGETMYEGLTSMEPIARRTVTDTMVRQAAYRAIQAGCCGFSYGAQGCWNGSWEFGDVSTTWGDLPWYLGIDLPGGAQMGHLRRFYTSFAWERQQPGWSGYVTEDETNAVFFPPIISADPECGRVVLLFGEGYRIGGGRAALTGLRDEPYRVCWFDAREGRFEVVDMAALPADGELALPDKPSEADWILLVEAESVAASETEVRSQRLTP